MVHFKNNIRNEDTRPYLCALPRMCFFELDKEIYALLFWDRKEDKYGCWRCRDGRMFTFKNIRVKPVDVTITADGYAN